MSKQRAFVWIALFTLALLACGTGDLVSMVGSNPTATRTLRPTFTPRASITSTPEDTATPEATDTPAATAAPATATKKAVATSAPRPPATAKPVGPAPTAAPSFRGQLADGYLCEQPNDPIWKITVRVNRVQPPNIFLGGYYIKIFSGDGRLLDSAGPSAADEYATMTLNGNCKVYNRYRSNLDRDVSQFRMQVPLIVRLYDSKDATQPIAPDFRADFGQPGNYYLQYNVTQ